MKYLIGGFTALALFATAVVAPHTARAGAIASYDHSSGCVVEAGPRATATGVATNTSVALVEARDQSTATGIAREGSVAIANAVGQAQAQAVALGGSIAVVNVSSGWGMAFAVNGSTAVVENGAVICDGEGSIAKASAGAGCRG